MEWVTGVVDDAIPIQYQEAVHKAISVPTYPDNICHCRRASVYLNNQKYSKPGPSSVDAAVHTWAVRTADLPAHSIWSLSSRRGPGRLIPVNEGEYLPQPWGQRTPHGMEAKPRYTHMVHYIRIPAWETPGAGSGACARSKAIIPIPTSNVSDTRQGKFELHQEHDHHLNNRQRSQGIRLDICVCNTPHI